MLEETRACAHMRRVGTHFERKAVDLRQAAQLPVELLGVEKIFMALRYAFSEPLLDSIVVLMFRSHHSAQDVVTKPQPSTFEGWVEGGLKHLFSGMYLPEGSGLTISTRWTTVA
jgi:hypothetical protein